MELQRLELYVSRMHNLVICYFVFKNQSHNSGVHGQRVNQHGHKMVISCSERLGVYSVGDLRLKPSGSWHIK